MDQVNKIPLKDLASDQATPDQLRYWCRLLGIRPEVSGRIAYLTGDQATQVKRMAAAIAAGMSPRDAVTQIGTMAFIIPAVAGPRHDDLRLDSLEKAVLSMAGRVGELVEEIRMVRQENQALRGEIALARLALAPPIPVELPRKVVPWSPNPIRDPAEGMPWWRVAWLSLVAPEQFRRYES